MMDPWGSFQNFINGFQKLITNPAQYAMENFGASPDIANDPDAIAQKLMSEGKITQQQYNAARQASVKIQNNPLFGYFIK